MDEVTYSDLLSPFERDIQKPTPKDKKYRKTWYIVEFIEKDDSSLAIRSDDSEATRTMKRTRTSTINTQLNTYTKTAVSLLRNKINELHMDEEQCTWKNVPDHLKQQCYQDIELFAKKANINLDRCIDSWGAKVLAAHQYPNANRKAKVSFQMKCIFFSCIAY